MDWVYLSPHLDDVALSVGGLVWDQAQAGQRVQIWTICAGDPPAGELSPFARALHVRWGIGREAVAGRRQEDLQACQILGATAVHFEFPDCIYRRSSKTNVHLYTSEEALWYPVHVDEQVLVAQVCEELQERFAPLPPDARLVVPLTLGNHIDHRLTRAAAEKVGRPLHFYADFPYVLRTGLPGKMAVPGEQCYQVSLDGMHAWLEAIAAHRSQISSFWESLDEMRSEVRAYYQEVGGIWLWGSA
jgi:LmbE family N-acetylglucosaminyl deacetylase